MDYFSTTHMYSTDPSECTYHGDQLVKHQCHKCNVNLVAGAAITANVKAGNIGRAISLLRLTGF